MNARARAVVLMLALLVPALGQQGANLLVIARDEYAPAVKPLVDWRHATGVRSLLVPTSVTGTSLAEIESYIDNAYNNWPIRPDYVLLVGHSYYVPSARYGSHWAYYSDNVYGDVDGDVRAEIAVGRFPVRSSTQCELMTAKCLAYERTPELSDTLWMRRLTTVVREGGDSDDTIYWNDARLAAGLAGGAGFVGCDSFSMYRGHDSADVAASVNAGTGFVLYRGAATANWPEPFGMHPERLANGRMLPVVVSATCATMALNPYDSMVGSAWVKAGTATAPKGAVAFFGNTHSDMHVARERSCIARGFFTGLFSEGRYRLGDAMLRAKEQLYQQFPYATDDYRGFSIFGDPTMPLWTGTPQLLSVSHPVQVVVGPQQLQVLVMSGGLPVAGAVVCASMDSTVYAVDTTDAGGYATMTVAPTDTGAMRLVVTGRDRYPYDGTIEVVYQVAAEEPAPARPSAVAVTATPSAFVRRTVVATAGAPPGARLLVLDAAGRTVRTLPVDGDAVTWTGDDDRGRRVRSGSYFLLLRDGQDRALGRTRVTRLD